MTSAAVAIALQAGCNPPALRFILQQYDESCQGELAALRAKHATLAAKGVDLPASQRDQEYAAAAACAKANMTALRLLLRLDPAPAGIVAATTLPAEEDLDTSLSLYDNAEQVLLHVARDWNDDTNTLVADRARMIRVLSRLVPPTDEQAVARSRVLVVGSGLGRMSFDLAQRGYDVDAIDASLAMTLAAVSMSERATASPEPCALPCHPWLLRSANLRDTAMRFRETAAPMLIQLPPPRLAAAALLATGVNSDAGSDALPPVPAPHLCFRHGRFPGPAEMAAAQTHDCVVSHFFIDAVSEDLTIVIDAMARALKPGGIWSCFGPLKWQQVPGRPASSFYSWSEVLLLVEAGGFELITAVRVVLFALDQALLLR